MQYAHLEKGIVRIQNKTPLITSEDLRKRGVKDGPQMGKLLKEGEQLAINEGIDEVEAGLKRLH